MGSDGACSCHMHSTRVSIHTPTWGVTAAERSDWEKKVVSIHTPTWGVTACPPALQTLQEGFNPHSHMGSDGELAEGKSLKISFNPHSHMGSDLVDTSAGKQAGSFNPHSHMGSDLAETTDDPLEYSFNPHSHMGSDRCEEGWAMARKKFQSTLPHGE